jgi:two-component system chemotaxis response regulator CheB
MPEGFTAMFAQRLDSMCGLDVKEAAEGDLVVPGRVLIAPGDRHLRVKRLPFGTIAVVGSSPPVNSHRPSVDVLFRSVAEEYGSKAVGLIMTGMGSDGAEGIGEILAQGGVTIAQSQEGCVIFGMPRVAIEKKNISHVVALSDMDGILQRCFTGRRELTDGKHGDQRTGRDVFLSHSR